MAHTNMPVLIYAPPGAMKTSFARTLRDYTAGRKPQDLSADPFGVCVVPIRLGTTRRPGPLKSLGSRNMAKMEMINKAAYQDLTEATQELKRELKYLKWTMYGGLLWMAAFV